MARPQGSAAPKRALLLPRRTNAGAFRKFYERKVEDNWLPGWLQAAGYDTYLVGKVSERVKMRVETELREACGDGRWGDGEMGARWGRDGGGGERGTGKGRDPRAADPSETQPQFVCPEVAVAHKPAASNTPSCVLTCVTHPCSS